MCSFNHVMVCPDSWAQLGTSEVLICVPSSSLWKLEHANGLKVEMLATNSEKKKKGKQVQFQERKWKEEQCKPMGPWILKLSMSPKNSEKDELNFRF